MGGKSSAPAKPDYTGAAEATAAGNIKAARVATKANRVNWDTPYGSLSYSQDPTDQDLWNANVQLDPAQQKLLEQQNATSQNLANLQDSATARVASALGQDYSSAYDPTANTNQATELLMARLAPQYARKQESLESQLANQGLQRGSEAYQNAMTDLGQQENDAYNQAALQGINLGMSQQSQQYNQETANRNAPLNELSAIRTGSQVTNPTFGSSAQQATTQGANYLGAAQSQGQSDTAAYNANVGSQNSMMSGLFGLGSASLMSPKGTFSGLTSLFSDERLKENIKEIGKTNSGLPVYSFNYIFDQDKKTNIGVMAQDVEKVFPDGVSEHESGYKMVDYGRIQ